MPSARVSAHTRNGQRVRSYTQGRQRSRAQQAADTGLGALVGVGAVASAVLDLTALVVNITALLLAMVFGSVLGVRLYRRTRRRPWSKRRKQVGIRRRRPHAGAPAKTTAPWSGGAAWSEGGRTAVYKREHDGSWKRVG